MKKIGFLVRVIACMVLLIGLTACAGKTSETGNESTTQIMDTFVDSYNLDGITMIPFCTSGSSGIGKSGKNLEKNAGSGNWLDGARFKGNVSEADLQKWIDSLR